jgi:cytochrome c oxidase subunit 1
MPRRIYRYDGGQGWDLYNLMSSIGMYIQVLGTAIGFYNLWRSTRRGVRAGNDPWGAPTLEWSIPSPPPDYNFARVPIVRSRYPLWDVKSPALTADVPHSRSDERRIDVDVAGKHVATADQAIGNPPGAPRPVAEARVERVETVPAGAPPATVPPRRLPTARELGIPMPNPSIKPLFVALFMTLMFASLIAIHKDQVMLAVILTIAFALALTFSLYSWLFTPLEDEHEHA